MIQHVSSAFKSKFYLKRNTICPQEYIFKLLYIYIWEYALLKMLTIWLHPEMLLKCHNVEKPVFESKEGYKLKWTDLFSCDCHNL